MGCEVYANGNTIACKAAAGKTVAAMPDVCLSPPSPPAGPIPIPYPNTGMASDTTEGSKTVQIGGQEVMLKNQSYFKQSSGDEAATKSLGMGVVTHQIQGKVNFINWSMDVKFEGANVPRHLDMTGHNEASDPPNCPPWPYMDAMAVGKGNPCKKDKEREKKACKGQKNPCKASGVMKKPCGAKKSKQAGNMADRAAANKCLAARRCGLQPYNPKKTKCCKGQTPHHLVEASAFFDVGRGGKGSKALSGIKNYNQGNAPCVCVEGKNQNTGTHGLMHTFQSASASKCKSKRTTYRQAKNSSVKAMQKVFPESKCDPACIKAQLDAYHNQCNIDNDTKIKPVETGDSSRQAVEAADQQIADRSAEVQRIRASGSLI